MNSINKDKVLVENKLLAFFNLLITILMDKLQFLNVI